MDLSMKYVFEREMETCCDVDLTALTLAEASELIQS